MHISDLETSLHRFSKMIIDPDDQDDVELDVRSSFLSNNGENISRDCEARQSEVDERGPSFIKDTVLMQEY